MHPLRIAAVALAAIAVSSAAGAETRTHLEGDLRPVGPLVPFEASLFNAPGAPAGTFALDAAGPDLDFRNAPGTLALVTDTGTLTASADQPPALYGVLRHDSESNLALKVGAPDGATCPTGEEPDCWVQGDAIPGDDAVFDALSGYWTLPPATVERTVDPSSLPLRPVGDPAQRATAAAAPALRRPVQAGGSGQFGRRDFVWDAGSASALSWNYLLLLVSMSGDGQPPITPGEFDPANPLAPGQCSYATPQYCTNVWVLFLFYTSLFGDDPLAPPTDRAMWQAGALYHVTEATGDLAVYAGGTVHALGLERARAHVAEVGVPLVLFPAAGTLEPTAPFAAATLAAPDAPTFGIAYATAPEPAGGALVAAALLAALARSRRRTRR